MLASSFMVISRERGALFPLASLRRTDPGFRQMNRQRVMAEPDRILVADMRRRLNHSVIARPRCTELD